jgi:hypothetical protein
VLAQNLERRALDVAVVARDRELVLADVAEYEVDGVPVGSGCIEAHRGKKKRNAGEKCWPPPAGRVTFTSGTASAFPSLAGRTRSESAAQASSALRKVTAYACCAPAPPPSSRRLTLTSTSSPCARSSADSTAAAVALSGSSRVVAPAKRSRYEPSSAALRIVTTWIAVDVVTA